MIHLNPVEYELLLDDPRVGERVVRDQISLVLIDGPTRNLPGPGSLPVVVAYIGDQLGGEGPPAVDVVVGQDSVDYLVTVATENPVAATSLVVLLRTIARLGVEAGLAAESAVYSVLQGGSEFTRWRSGQAPSLLDQDSPAVLLDRIENSLMITLNRPHRHNAITRQLRDELCEALAVALLDESIVDVRIAGRGSSFCSGGDLAEFGARSNVADAHRLRLALNPAKLLHRLRRRTSVAIHGSTLGGGIEMAAFAGRVLAQPGTQIGLPEVRLGLIPGAGGTVSITRRIGRQRCAALALGTDTINVRTALAWGLVDGVSTEPPGGSQEWS